MLTTRLNETNYRLRLVAGRVERGLLVIFIAATLAVFAAAFEVGRATSTHDAPAVESSVGLSLASSGGLPVSLSAVPALPAFPAPPVRARRRPQVSPAAPPPPTAAAALVSSPPPATAAPAPRRLPSPRPSVAPIRVGSGSSGTGAAPSIHATPPASGSGNSGGGSGRGNGSGNGRGSSQGNATNNSGNGNSGSFDSSG
jgi:hypothetical protein